MIGLVLALQAATQLVLPNPDTSSPACQVINLAEEKPISNLYVLCGTAAVWLGHAETFKSSYNQKLRSLLVVSEGAGGQRVHLVTLSGDGRAHLDDVTRQLVKLSGRYQDARLDAAIDMSAFASGGTVSISDSSAGESDGNSKQTAVAKVQLDLLPFAEEGARSIDASSGAPSPDKSMDQAGSASSGGR